MEQVKELHKKLAQVESRLDHTEAELGYLNQILLTCGFPDGINTLKRAIEDLLAGASMEDLFPPESPPTQNIDPVNLS